MSRKWIESEIDTKPCFLYPAIVFPDQNYELERRRIVDIEAQHTGEEIALGSGVED